MSKVERQKVWSFVQTLVAVIIGGVISYLTVVAQSHVQARTEQTMAAYAAYIGSLTVFAQAVAERRHDLVSRKGMARARGSIAIYGTPQVIAKLPDIGSIEEECVKEDLISAIEAMRQDVGEEPVDRADLHRLVFGDDSQPKGNCAPRGS